MGVRKKIACADGASLPGSLMSVTLPNLLQQVAGRKMRRGGEGEEEKKNFFQQSPVKQKGIFYIQQDGVEDWQSYEELLTQAETILFNLRKLGLKPQAKVILQLHQGRDFLAVFWGCILGGFIPVPLAVAPSYTTDNGKANLLRYVWELVWGEETRRQGEGEKLSLQPCLVVTDRNLSGVIDAFAAETNLKNFQSVTVEDLLQGERDSNYYCSQPEDLALILFTSGSTGKPKGVMLSHGNLLSSMFGMATVNKLSQDDITLNWMPLEHVASLVMFHLTQVYLGCQQIHVANELVLKNPLQWLDIINKYRVTVTWSPNFGYGLINDCLTEIKQDKWDLSCLRWMGNGAEAVVGKTTRKFLKLLASYGLKSNVVSPGYGMSETCSGIVHSDSFSLESTTNEEEFIDLGFPIPGVSIRIVNQEHQILVEEEIGLLQVKGATVTVGYYGLPDLNQEIFTEDAWFNTGDLAFIHNGKLTITGRQKDVIVINSFNYYNHEIEAVVEELKEVEVSYTAACGVRSKEDNTEKLSIFFHPTSFEDSFLVNCIKKIRQVVVNKININPTYLIPVQKSLIPKTSIGKIQRQQLVQDFQTGKFDDIIKKIKTLIEEQNKSDRVLPRNELEQQLVAIWQEVLILKTVGIKDNFFELGGNSILLMQVLNKIQNYPQQSLSAVTLFQYPTIEKLAEYLSQTKTEVKIKSRRKQTSTDIAVIGMSCRFPGAKNIAEFWQNLCDGVESITFFSNEEIAASGINPNLINHPNYVKASPIIEDIEYFDAEFFGYSPKEAQLIDPQQRLLLECAWSSLEDAGCDPLTYPGVISLYAGAATNTYLLNNIYPNRNQLDDNEDLDVFTLTSMGGFQATVANDKDYLTTRVSYKLNLTGASVNVQTACSTSLVAIHLACQSLINGECDMALAGGVSLHVPQKVGYLYQEGMILSPDGHCRAFDAQASGTIFGSGVGVVVLKPLSNAITDRDRIYAVIKGSAINNDGGTKVGYFAPNSEGQAKAVAEAIAVSGIATESISYIEAHGTGTILGDPIELAGLSQAFSLDTNKKRFCAIGSVKTNVGHLQIASGIVGFIKTVLCLYHQKIPPSLHFDTPNPQIDFVNSPFYVNTVLKQWNKTDYPRRAGINSLGIGGTNAHVILEEFLFYPVDTFHGRYLQQYPINLLTLSAKNQSALKELTQQYINFLQFHPNLSLEDICYTANTGRSHFNCRLAVTAETIPQLIDKLQNYLTATESFVTTKSRPKIAFLFTGQGSQYLNMGKKLYQTQPLFRQTLDRCAEILQPYLDQPLLSIIYPDDLETFHETSLQDINQTQYTQPTLFAIAYSLAQLWISWGIKPDAVLGHSLGEYVAACLAGVFSLEDALKLVATRGKLMQKLPQNGIMVSILATEEVVKKALVGFETEISIAAINGNHSIVISGKKSAIETVISKLEAEGIKTKQLNVSHAFHSSLMQPILTEFERFAREINYTSPQINLISNLTGKIATSEIATSEYWCAHILQTVQFTKSIETLNQAGYQVLIECGAKPTLLGMTGELLHNSDSTLLLPSLRPEINDEQIILDGLAQLYLRGIDINWINFYQDYQYHKISLPTYPFQKQRCWIEKNQNSKVRTERSECIQNKKCHLLLGKKLRSPVKEIIFQSEINVSELFFLQDHKINQEIIFPATAYLEIALAAGNNIFSSSVISLEDIEVEQALILSDKQDQTIQTIINQESTTARFKIYSLLTDESWHLHCSGKIILSESATARKKDLSKLQKQFVGEISGKEHYQQCQQKNIDYGLSFQGVQQIWYKETEALAFGKISLPELLKSEQHLYQFHPALLDACLQIILAALPHELQAATYIPVSLKNLYCHQTFQEDTVWSHVKLQPITDKETEFITADVSIYDNLGNLILEIKKITAKKINQATASWRNWLYEIQWQDHLPVGMNRCLPETNHQFFTQKHCYLIFDNEDQLGKMIKRENRECILVYPSYEYKIISEQKFQINCQQKEDYSRLLKEITAQNYSLQGIIYLWSLDNSDNQTNLSEIVPNQCSQLLYLIQALINYNWQNFPRLWIVTKGCQVTNFSPYPPISLSPLWGMVNAINLEHPELNCTLIDLDSSTSTIDSEILFKEITSPDQENRIIYREGKRKVARLVRKLINSNQNQPLQLEITKRGTLDNLQWQPTTRRQPNNGEVEIKVHSVGLNFRDILNALGMYPGEAGKLGLECSGEIVAVGKKVDQLKVGDEIIAIASGSFSNYVTVDANLVIAKPTSLSFTEAATIPTAFLTAYYCLHHLAEIKPGDKILIHSAAGGVGLAAIQLAKQVGAEIFATASLSKWEYLQSLGIKHIFNSRSLDFANKIFSLTAGKGIDIVLNSLSGEFISKSLSVLNPDGCFIEIGKKDIWDKNQIETIQPNVSYFLVDLIEVTQQQPELIQSMLCDLITQFNNGSFQPLPCKQFSQQDVTAAFRYMQQAKHIGKIVIQNSQFNCMGELLFAHNASYLITGGLGALGLEVTQWMIEKGAKHLILISRNQPSQNAQATINQLQQNGTTIQVIQADIADLEAVNKIIQKYYNTEEQKNFSSSPLHPLKGIIHAAGIIDDGAIINLTKEKFTKVISPKVQGAWNLHQATQNLSLDFFVMFSSAASILGSSGQANYCAANAFLDNLAHYRRSLGLPALTINWGAWDEIGMATNTKLFSNTKLIGKVVEERKNKIVNLNAHQSDEEFNNSFKIPGMGKIQPKQGIEILEYLLSTDAIQVGILPIDWSKWQQQLPLFANFINHKKNEVEVIKQSEILQQLEIAQPSELKPILINYLCTEVGQILGLNSSDTIDIEQGFTELGIDSLSSVELRNKLQTNLQCKLSSTLIYDYPTIISLAEYLINNLFATDIEQNIEQPENIDSVLSNLENLSEEEAENLLINELDNFNF
ncbi:Phenylalanine racemase (ATP-hydrolyzing), Mycocerosate synthase [Stanieria cyanosphaera PCC 7437]|uniref:Phenolphthiocerol/phthiocerol polyketide synthase subunit E n=1 Tax=Stanieria cyanosphaera (strain ATCC 29371 / PCC 7437) TaxID=111780 RepID=K9XMT7_STAC7|nr:type I polyketide synthase [Stanieria cyanosphaera]AFZ33823.1 Phenylalanine racemase (ATP-hydrolyzing), Mycocerosate synthase [Stanieria cyanosphaera PCC 7437]